jgi:hypothetical protein
MIVIYLYVQASGHFARYHFQKINENFQLNEWNQPEADILGVSIFLKKKLSSKIFSTNSSNRKLCVAVQMVILKGTFYCLYNKCKFKGQNMRVDENRAIR